MKVSNQLKNDTIVVSFNEEEFIPDLFGLYDKNLHRIEALLNVNLQGRGKNISISGKDVVLAKNVLNDLYDQLKKGFDIGFEEVDASIRMNSEININSDKKQNDVSLIKTKKKTVRARTHKQNEYILALNKSELTFGVGPAGTGKTFLPVVHAVELLEKEEVSKRLKQADVVITTAQVFGAKSPILIPKSLVNEMKPGSVIIDLASSTGGNCELTKDSEIVEYNRIKIVGNSFLSSEISYDSSNLFSNNVFNFLSYIIKDDKIIEEDDEIINNCKI